MFRHMGGWVRGPPKTRAAVLLKVVENLLTKAFWIVEPASGQARLWPSLEE